MNKRMPFSRTKRKHRYRINRMFKKQDGKCVYCNIHMWLQWHPENIFKGSVYHGHKNEMATIEHLKPQKRGGRNTVDNLVLSCSECNRDRGHVPYSLYKLMKISKSLHRFIKCMYSHYNRNHNRIYRIKVRYRNKLKRLKIG